MTDFIQFHSKEHGRSFLCEKGRCPGAEFEKQRLAAEHERIEERGAKQTNSKCCKNSIVYRGYIEVILA